jgi:integrase
MGRRAPLVPRARKGAADEGREAFSAEEVGKLLAGLGGAQAQLFRLLLVTGCRVDEVAKLTVGDVEPGAIGFTIRSGKTVNATRYVPVPVLARGVPAGLVSRAKDTRLFPSIPIRAATGKAAAASQTFTRERRRILGPESDGRLALHSTRHTWLTIARRAGLHEEVRNELGGWAGRRLSPLSTTTACSASNSPRRRRRWPRGCRPRGS